MTSLPSLDAEISPHSDVVPIDRGQLVSALLEAAQGHVDGGEPREALALLHEANALVSTIGDGVECARHQVMLGELWIALDDARRARSCFEPSAIDLDDADEPELLARCLFGLGRALTMLHDPVGRSVLEDAGSLFEELGDDAGARAVEVELRHLPDELDELDEAPRSFQMAAVAVAR